MKLKHAITASVVALLGASGPASTGEPAAADGVYFVILDTLANRQNAQERAAVTGSWVLDTSLYTDLEPGAFAVVRRGPYTSQEEAQARLQSMTQHGGWPTARMVYGGQAV